MVAMPNLQDILNKSQGTTTPPPTPRRSMPVVAPTTAENLSAKLRLFAGDIKIAHTVFALPFALFAAFLGAGGFPGVLKLVLILLCMVTARTVAMAANRLLDAELDRRNARTAVRAIPSGRLSPVFYAVILVLCALLFIGATLGFLYFDNAWPAILSLPVLLFLVGYPLMKRFTHFCHYYLGGALALAPICAWIAVTGSLANLPWVLPLAVLLWTAGFDILYACQDYESDVENRVFSVPAALGIGRALLAARFTHAACVLSLFMLGIQSPSLGGLYFVALTITVILLVVEHCLVDEKDLSRLNVAFFTLNGVISLVLSTLGIINVLLK
jgi:4-hydroxybenzoate polyprenyltransferase